MQLTLNIRPTRVTGSSRDLVLSSISSGHVFSTGTNGNYLAPYTRHGSETIRVYNLEKRRKRVEIQEDHRTSKKSRKVIRPAHWVGHYYDIPRDFLAIARVRVVQHTRFFEITAKKR
jgi:hypothetical protein